MESQMATETIIGRMARSTKETLLVDFVMAEVYGPALTVIHMTDSSKTIKRTAKESLFGRMETGTREPSWMM